MRRLGYLAVIGALAAATPAAAVTIVNGSFEAPDFSPGQYVYGVAAPGWTFANGAGITTNASAWGFNDAPDGDQVAFLQNVSSATQTLTGLTIGQTYTVNFDLSNRPGYSNILVDLSFGGTSIFSLTPTNSWSSYSATFLASATTGDLVFSTNTGFGDHDAGLDNVSISGAVPEPATWAIMIAGFGLTGAALRRHRARMAIA